jgi:hypothetical protein
MQSKIDYNRLAQLLGMLGSDFDGEVVNAARLAHKLVTTSGLCWADVIKNTPACGSAPLGAQTGRRRRGRGGKVSEDNDLDAATEAGFSAGVKQKPAQSVRTYNWRQWAEDIVRLEEDCLSAWEINFFGSYAASRRVEPSDKQRAIFVRVAERLDLALPERPRPENENAL